MHKITVFICFLLGAFLVLYGFFLTATVKGLVIMLFGVMLLIASLFLYNKRA